MRALGREQVLAALRAAGGRSAHVMEIVQALGLPKSARDDVRQALAGLVELGLARELPGSRFRPGPERRPRPSAPNAPWTGGRRAAGTTVAGWLALTPRGFGFVTADDGGPDVFVSARALGTAMHGDRIEVSTRPSAQGREGEVHRVLERGLSRVAGVLVRGRRNLVLETQDPRLPPVFRIVGTPPLGTEAGTDVVAQITSWPELPGEIPEARVLVALGPRGSAETEIAKILIREGVLEEFPDEVVKEALGFPPEVPAADAATREDLRPLDLVTIDPEDARDHDDAVWAEQERDGSFRVVIAIADVSHYVREGSAIDREALARGCSIYLPGRAIPMLPPEISTNLASLVPDEDRLTLAVDVKVASNGRVVSHRLVEGVMRSRARLTYGGVARALGLTEGPPQPDAEARLPMLRVLAALSKTLRARRMERGALEFELPEAKVVLEAGEPVDVVRSRSDPGVKAAYAIVEDLMLLANEVIAEDLTRKKLPAIYRVHGKPDPRKVETFAAVAEAFGHALEEGAAESPKKLQRFLAKVAGTSQGTSLAYLLLRSMQQATYDVTNLGHFALAARDYLHFTSPIRRYPDLAVHRLVRQLARSERIEAEELRRRLMTQAIQSSRMERRAMTVERDVMALYRCLLVRDRVGDEFEGTVTGVTEHGAWVAADAPFVEMRIPIDRIGEDFYALDRLGIRLVGQRSGHALALGDRLVVRVESVALDRREIVASPAGRASAPGARPRVPPRSSRSKASPQKTAAHKAATPRTGARPAGRKKR